jgi:hypothetical protein
MHTIEAVSARLTTEVMMARSDTRYSIYPAPKAIQILGGTSPALNEAIECWAALLVRASGDNSKTFSESYGEEGPYPEHPLHEWGVLADALKEIRLDPDFPHPGILLAAAVDDAYRLEDAGYKWFSSEHGERMKDDEYARYRDKAIAGLVKKLRDLDPVHAWAIIVTVRWFWANHADGINIKDPWWTVAFRRQWGQQHSASKRGGVAPNQGKGRKGRTKKPPSQ